MLVVEDMRRTDSAPFCEGFVQRVRNWDAGMSSWLFKNLVNYEPDCRRERIAEERQ